MGKVQLRCPRRPAAISTPFLLDENRLQRFVMVDVAGKKPLTFHAAKMTLMVFLRSIVIDSLSLPVRFPSSTSRTRPATPSAASSILPSAGVVVLGEQGVLPVVTQNGDSLQNVALNVFYLAGHLVDRLWQGILGLVLVFIVQLIAPAKKRWTASISSSSSASAADLGICWASSRCLNRCVLYILSRPAESVSEQMSILEVLRKLTTHRYVSVRPFTFHFKNKFFFDSAKYEFGVWVWQPRLGVYRLCLLLFQPDDVARQQQRTRRVSG